MCTFVGPCGYRFLRENTTTRSTRDLKDLVNATGKSAVIRFLNEFTLTSGAKITSIFSSTHPPPPGRKCS